MNPNSRVNSKSHLFNSYLKATSPIFISYSYLCPAKTLHHLAKLKWPEANLSKRRPTLLDSISAMEGIRGGHTDPSVSLEQRPRASSPLDSSQVPVPQIIPSSEGGVPSSPPQQRYATWRPPRSPPPEPSVCKVPPKRARTLGPGESFRHPKPEPSALTDS